MKPSVYEACHFDYQLHNKRRVLMSRPKLNSSPVDEKGSTVEKPMDIPTNFEETFTVCKPLGLRVQKQTLRVTYVETNSVLTDRVFRGDQILSVDGHAIQNDQQLHQLLADPKPAVTVRVRHAFFSYCKFNGATIERLQLEREVFKSTGRAIELFTIYLRVPFDLEESRSALKWGIRYDSRERVQVVHVDPNGLAAVHFKAGDIIREVNDRPIASKAMLHHWICAAIERGDLIRMSIERPVGGDETVREQFETPTDVLEIAQKQIQEIRAGRLIATQPAMKRSNSRSSRTVKIDEKPREQEIQSDHDVAKLKSCKGNKN
ncbi:hypothetical protein M3Y95_00336600 [Aphelenchoides besseyi]|nr:hypothetical protein M3Y95_00336600 [Aphelenchoides besseyi]